MIIDIAEEKTSADGEEGWGESKTKRYKNVIRSSDQRAQ
jgi:hypothetical protein